MGSRIRDAFPKLIRLPEGGRFSYVNDAFSVFASPANADQPAQVTPRRMWRFPRPAAGGVTGAVEASQRCASGRSAGGATATSTALVGNDDVAPSEDYRTEHSRVVHRKSGCQFTAATSCHPEPIGAWDGPKPGPESKG